MYKSSKKTFLELRVTNPNTSVLIWISLMSKTQFLINLLTIRLNLKLSIKDVRKKGISVDTNIIIMFANNNVGT